MGRTRSVIVGHGRPSVGYRSRVELAPSATGDERRANSRAPTMFDRLYCGQRALMGRARSATVVDRRGVGRASANNGRPSVVSRSRVDWPRAAIDAQTLRHRPTTVAHWSAIDRVGVGHGRTRSPSRTQPFRHRPATVAHRSTIDRLWVGHVGLRTPIGAQPLVHLPTTVVHLSSVGRAWVRHDQLPAAIGAQTVGHQPAWIGYRSGNERTRVEHGWLRSPIGTQAVRHRPSTLA